MFNKFSLILVILLSTSASSSFASVMPDWVQFIDEEVTSASIALEQAAPETEATASCIEEEFYLRRFWMRVRAKVGIQIPVLAKFEVIPEIEMLWERPLPEGWKPYHPIE